jgi:hypothetical protein
MSIRIMTEIWDNPPASQGQLLVLLALSDNADEETRKAWPSVRALARKTVLSERQVQQCLRTLAEKKIIDIEFNAGPSGTNVYRVRKPSEWGGAKTAGGELHFTGGVNSTSPGGVNSTSPEPSLRTIKEPSESARVRDALMQVLSKETADAFIAMRKTIKAPLTVRAAELIVAKLRTCRDPNYVANVSIENSWRGVFPEQEQRRPAQPSRQSSSFIDQVNARYDRLEGGR